MQKTPTCSAVILTGGLNTRMDRRNKAFMQLDGRSFLARILNTVKAHLDDCVLVTREPELYRAWPVKVASDRLTVRSPLTGIHAGLLSISSDYALVVGCDTPLLKEGVVARLLAELDPGADVIVPAAGTYFQPLCALYSRRCAPVIEQLLASGEVKVDRLFARVRLKTVAYRHFKVIDPDLVSFFNVNTLADLDTAKALFTKKISVA